MSRRTAIFVLLVVIAVFWTLTAYAQSEQEIRAQIESGAQQIVQLKQEIQQLQGELNATTEQKQTFQTAVKSLDLNIQKLTKSISLTNAQITQKDTEIGELSGSILTTEERIALSREQIGNSLRELELTDAQPVAVALLGGVTLSELFDQAAALEALRSDLQNHIQDLSSLKVTFETDKGVAEKKRAELAALKRNLDQEKQGLAIARGAQDQLLTETKNKESNYQDLIEQKQAQEDAFEEQLRQLEAQLNLTVDSSAFAAPRPGILQWPLEQPHITQYFGNTPFATANPQVYGKVGHNGIDLRASDGTPIKAALAGVVSATGNTDAQKGCYSYGKWVLIKHNNGLSTLYAHLSLISVSQGQTMTTGQLVGYSGRTGYATGPHLHFGVFATAGVKVTQFTNSINCKQVVVPLVDPTAYLNPLSYLPTL